MTLPASITSINYLHTLSNNSKEDFKGTGNGSLFSSALQSVNSSEKSSVNNLHSSSRVSSINEAEVKDIYQKIRIEANEDLDSANFTEKVFTIFDYLDGSIDKIMGYPLDVKIDRDEFNTAILYNRMGINFLDIKRLEVRMELLELARKESQENKHFMSMDKFKALIEKIDDNLLKLEDMKQSILDAKVLRA